MAINSEKFKKLLLTKGKPISEVQKQAKLDVLGDLQGHTKDMLSEKLDGIKKVTVASNTKEGLKKGVKTAEKVIDKLNGKPEEESEEPCQHCEGMGCPECAEESEEHESSESPEEEVSEHESGEESSDESEMSEEELDAKIAELMKKKDSLKSKA